MNRYKNIVVRLIKYFNRLKRNFDLLLVQLCYKSKFLSSLYYFLFSSTFHREHQAVLAGRISHSRMEQNFFRLIRNTHRIEKGLTMRPRRDVFAVQYLTETIDAFVKIWNNRDDFKGYQLEWSHDVLEEYFNVVDLKNGIVENNYRRFLTALNDNPGLGSSLKNGKVFRPYKRSSTILSNIKYEEFLALTRQRRSVRWFKDKKVPRELIDKAIMAALQSPSACNRQPFEMQIFDDEKLTKELVNLPMGTAGFGHNIPVLLVMVGNLDAYDSERDRHLIYIDASLANMTMMLALETLGLSSCPINWPDIEERERLMTDKLNLKKYQRPIMCMAIGFADSEGEIPFSEKKNIELSRKYN
jgi:nitroreductase